MSNFRVFRGGIPVQVDVRKLEEAYGLPEIGTMIPWESIEKTLGFKRDTFRFRTVTNSWRKMLFRVHNIWMGAITGKGLQAANPHERIVYASKKHASGTRFFKRAALLSVRTSRESLSPEEIRTADHLENLAAIERLISATAPKPLARLAS